MPDLRARIERSITLSGAPINDSSMGAYIVAELLVVALVDDEILPSRDEVEMEAVHGITQALRETSDFRHLGWYELSRLIEPIVTQLIVEGSNA